MAAHLLKHLAIPLHELSCVIVMCCSVANMVCHMPGAIQRLLFWHCRQTMCPGDFFCLTACLHFSFYEVHASTSEHKRILVCFHAAGDAAALLTAVRRIADSCSWQGCCNRHSLHKAAHSISRFTPSQLTRVVHGEVINPRLLLFIHAHYQLDVVDDQPQ